MALIATDTPVLSELVKYEYPVKNLSRAYCKLTVAEGEILKIGQVVGKITATGAFALAKETAADGSKAFYGAIVALPEGADYQWKAAKAGEVKVMVLARPQAMLNPEALILDSTYDTAEKKKALYNSIKAKGISLAKVNNKYL